MAAYTDNLRAKKVKNTIVIHIELQISRSCDFTKQRTKSVSFVYALNKRMQRTPMRFLLKVFLQNEAEICEKKNTGQCFSIKSKTTCKNSAHLDDILKKWPKSSLTIVFHKTLQL